MSDPGVSIGEFHRATVAKMALRAWIVLLICGSTSAFAAQPFGVDLAGRPVDRLAPPGARAIVLFFAASDCPICNRYIPEMQRLDREFAPAGVRFWWVYPNPEDTAEVVRRHQQQFDIRGDTVLDTEQRLTTMAHATITPEVAVFVPGKDTLREVYRGRIDDRYLSLGQERPSADKHELEIALRALTANRPVPAPGGPPVGCSIVPRSEP
ncbi:MAG: redoxin domain-containing protein [Acidobacteriaceae bacterium]